MIEHGLYSIKKEFLNLIDSLGGDCDLHNGYKRPVYCCIKDEFINDIYWAIPTSDLSHRSEEQNKRYEFYLSLPDKDLRSCYYHKAKTTKEALFKISSCYPIIDKYIDHEFTTSGKHVIMKRKDSLIEIERKLKRILSFENNSNNYFPQKITEIKKYLINELEFEKLEKESAITDEPNT
jgi:hypothetical protein